MKKKFLTILVTLLLAAVSTAAAVTFVAAQPVTGTETDRTKIGAFHEAWGSAGWMPKITAAFVDEYERLESIGFNPGTVMAPVESWEIGFKQEFENGDGTYEAWGHAGRSCIMFYNALKDTAYSMYNAPYEAWMSGSNKDTLLMPTSYQYKIGDDVYQNFSGGYTKNTTVVAGKNIKDIATATTEDAVELTKAEMYCHTYAGDIWNNLGGAELHDVVKAMSDAVIALQATGFDVGSVAKEGCKAWGTQQASGTIVVADMTRSASNTYIWSEGDGRNGMIMYNPNTGKAHVLYDEIAKKYIEFKLTTPKGDMFTKDEIKYQNFTNGYIKVEGGAASFVMNKNFDAATGTEIGAFDIADIGAFDAGSEASAEVKAAVSAAVREKATEEALEAPVSFVTDKGNGFYAQGFESSMIFVKVSGEAELTTEVIYLSDAIYTAYTTAYGFYVPEDEMGAGSAIRLGNPTAAPFEAANKTFVNFDRGCIVYDGTAAEVKTGFKAKADGTVEDLVFESVAFIGSNYTKPANVTLTDEQLIAKFNAKYSSLMTAGFNLGAPDDGGISLWTKAGYVAGAAINEGDGWIKQGFIGGDSEGFTFGINSYLVYNITKDEVYLIRDYVLSQMQYLLYVKGAPTADTIVTGNTMKQQFEGGYINATKNWGAFMFYDGKNIGDPLDDEEEEEEGGNNEEKPGCGGCGSMGAAGMGGSIALMLATAAGAVALLFVKKKQIAKK